MMNSRILQGLGLWALCFNLGTDAQATAVKTLGNPKAPQGGTYLLNMGAEPNSLHPINSTDLYGREVQVYVLESLLGRNEDTNAWEPALAESWTISKDGKVFTFKLRPGVKWHDGKDFTVEDVKFSYDAIFDDRFMGAPERAYLESIEKVEIVDPKTIRFTVKDLYYKNFDVVASLTILPKHIYDVPKTDKLNRVLIGTGPYMLDHYDRGQRIVLKKNPTWWGTKVPANAGQYNFANISYRFVKEENVQFEMFKKGDLDMLALSPEMYEKKAVGPEWGKTVEKVKTVNKSPKSYGFIGWNFKSDLFKDRDVRIAMTHLMNRRLMIEKFLYNMSIPATGPLHQFSKGASSKVKTLEFDPAKAAALLKKAGWTDSDKNGILDKMINGQKREFRFQLLVANADSLKYFTIFKEDARKAGVDIDVKLVEWNAFVKLLDERKFEAMALAWGGGSVDWEPKQIWRSHSMAGGGSNFISYSNPQVDKLIDEARIMQDEKARTKKLEKIYELIAADAPYLFMFNTKFSLYGVSKKIGRVKDTYNYGIGTNYWWKKE